VKEMSVDEIRRAVHGRWRTPATTVVVGGVSTDTRTVQPGDLFIALKGDRFDAHDFLADAAAAGCVAAIVRHDARIARSVLANIGGGVIGVRDTTEALGQLAAYHRARCPATVVAVTGSNGKTTVKRMIDHILSRRSVGSCSPKSFNNAVGVPLTLLSAGWSDDYVVCELGTNAPGEIASLAAIARPDIAVIASVSEAHLAGLGTIERVAVEKAAILSGLGRNGVAVVWSDSDALDKALRPYDGVRLIRFGCCDEAQLRLTGYEPESYAQRFEINNRLWVPLPLPGRHNALNALAAIAVAQRMGFSQAEAAEALADFAGLEMRLERMSIGPVTVLNDAYNANPASVAAAAEALSSARAKRRVLIVGDMKELGATAESLHVSTGRKMADHNVDLLIGVGALGRYIAAGAAQVDVATESFVSVKQAGSAMGELLRDGDAVLIKGSRAMGMECLLEPIRRAFEPSAPTQEAAKAHKPKASAKRAGKLKAARKKKDT